MIQHKKIIALYLFLAAITLNAQKNKQDSFQTLFQGEFSKISLYGGPLLEYSRVIDQNALFVGGQISMLLNNKFGIGLLGKGIATLNTFKGKYKDKKELDIRLYVGLGGISLSRIFNLNKSIHFNIFSNFLIGKGSLYKNDGEETKKSANRIDNKLLLGIEPGLGIELNLTKFLILNIMTSYRYLTSNDGVLLNLKNNDLNGFTIGVHLKFGKFE